MDINQIIDQLKAGSDDITLREGVPESTLNWFESQMKVVMPPEFRAFYQFCNGFESAADAFRMLSLNEIVTDRHTNHWKRLTDNRFYFAEYLQYCDMWSVKMGSSWGMDYSIFCSSGNDEKIIMTHSLTEFLSCFLANGVFGESGLYDWGDEIAKGHKTG